MANRRIHLDLEDAIADAAGDRAHDLRIPKKRYIELLIERDVAEAKKKGGKPLTNPDAKK